ncbi:MAG: hypothetical protein IKU68_04720, partial [Oscillospiraceae bacterium]|nr:hypothetical protein [Oscillospiraceae bacterium]
HWVFSTGRYHPLCVCNSADWICGDAPAGNASQTAPVESHHWVFSTGRYHPLCVWNSADWICGDAPAGNTSQTAPVESHHWVFSTGRYHPLCVCNSADWICGDAPAGNNVTNCAGRITPLGVLDWSLSSALYILEGSSVFRLTPFSFAKTVIK